MNLLMPSPHKDRVKKPFIATQFGIATQYSTMKFSVVALIACASLLSKSEAFVSPTGAKTCRSLTSLAVSQADLDGAQAMIDEIILEKNCNPFFVRLAWHDSGTHDVNVKGDWPAAGGAIGSIRFDPGTSGKIH